MIQPVPTPPPKPRYPQWLVLPYAYAACLCILVITALMGVGGFDFAGIAYETPGSPLLVLTVSLLSIFALPFLLRLRLSSLARFFSATFALVTPWFLLASAAYLMAEQVLAVNVFVIAAAVLLVALGAGSFAVLGGGEALKLSRK